MDVVPDDSAPEEAAPEDIASGEMAPPNRLAVGPAPYVLVRVAGLPFEVTHGLCGDRAAAIARDLDTLQAELDTAREGLCDRLFSAAGRCTEANGRHALLTVKRAVFNDRPVAATVLRAAESAVGAGVACHLHTWADQLRRAGDLLRVGEQALACDRAVTATRLYQLSTSPVIGTGVLFAQPHLFDELTWAASLAPAERPSALTRTLAAYCYRAATKTSPFSSFTSTAVRRPTQLPPVADSLGHVQSTFTLNAAVIESLEAALTGQEEISGRLPLYLNDTAESVGARVTFLATHRIVQAAMAPLGRDERLVEIDRNPLLDLIVSLVGRMAGHWTTLSLEQHLGEGLPDGSVRRQLSRVLRQLVDSGLLRRSLEYDAGAPEALRRLATTPLLARTPTGAAVQAHLQQAEAALRGLRGASPATARELLVSVHRHVGGAFEAVGAIPVGLRQQRLVQHDTYHHVKDYVQGSSTPDPQVSAPNVLLACALPALTRLQAMLPLFNVELPWRRLVQGFAVEHCAGAERSLLDLYREFCALGAAYERLPDVPYEIRARQSVITELRELADRADGGQAELPVPLLRRFADLARPFRPVTAVPSAGYLGQLWLPRPGEHRFVLNRILPGYGALASRAAAAAGHEWLAEALREMRRLIAPDADVVDLVGTFGFDGQRYPRLERWRLTYPGEAVRPGPDLIAWHDVLAAPDPLSGAVRLRYRRTGRWLLPLPAGTLGPGLLPPFFRFVLAFGLAFLPHFPLADLLDEGRPRDDGIHMRHYPRLCHDGVVLLRRTWRVPATALPWAGQPKPAGFGEFRRTRAWAREADLPRRVFVRSAQEPDGDGTATRLGYRRRAKPFFVDWDDATTHELLRRFTAAGQGTLTITEMLPVPDEAPCPPGTTPHVTEYFLELVG